jgi:hypothetical protein
MSLCKYKDMFGEPGIGSHAYRIPVVDVAASDVILTALLGFFLSKYLFGVRSNYSFWITFLILFVISIIAHRAFCVRSTVDKFLFKNNQMI